MSTGEEPGVTPDYLAAAEAIAAERGITVQEVLDSAMDPVLNPTYPGPDCYLPDEVLDYQRTGELPKDRLRHRQECWQCAALLDTVVPDPEQVKQFRREVMAARQRDQQAARLAESRSKAHSFFGMGSWNLLALQSATLSVLALLAGTAGVNRYIAKVDAQSMRELAAVATPQPVWFNVTTAPVEVKDAAPADSAPAVVASVPVKVNKVDGSVTEDSYSHVAAAVALPGSVKFATIGDWTESYINLCSSKLVNGISTAMQTSGGEADKKTFEANLQSALASENVVAKGSTGAASKYAITCTPNQGPAMVTLDMSKAYSKAQAAYRSLEKTNGQVQYLGHTYDSPMLGMSMSADRAVMKAK